MSNDLTEFDILYSEVEKVMDDYTNIMSMPLGMYDIWGGDNGKQISMYVLHMEYIRPSLIKKLQNILVRFPNREIVFSVTSPGDVNDWPGMGLYIRRDIIIDGLLRQYFPPEYQSIIYEGSRSGDKYDSITLKDERPDFKPLFKKIDGALAAIAARKSIDPRGEYEVFDDFRDYESLQMFASAAFMQPDVIAELQGILRDFPNWVLLVYPGDTSGPEDMLMLLEVRHDEIVDRLDRRRLPPEYASLRYPGARREKPLRMQDGD